MFYDLTNNIKNFSNEMYIINTFVIHFRFLLIQIAGHTQLSYLQVSVLTELKIVKY
jgi:hypothetical protein